MAASAISAPIVGSVVPLSTQINGAVPSSSFRCGDCSFSTVVRAEYLRHRNTKCRKTVTVHYPGIPKLDRAEDGKFHCPYCPLESDNTNTLNAHSKRCRPKDSSAKSTPKPSLKRKSEKQSVSETESLSSMHTDSSSSTSEGSEDEDDVPHIPDKEKPLPPFHDTNPSSPDYPELTTIRMNFSRASTSLSDREWPYQRGEKPSVQIDYFKHVGFGQPPRSLPGIPGDLYLDYTTSNYPIVYVYLGEETGWWCYNEASVVLDDRKRWLGVFEHPTFSSRYLWASETKGLHWSGAASFQAASICARNDDRPDAADWFTRFICDSYEMISIGARRDWTRIPSEQNTSFRKQAEAQRRAQLRPQLDRTKIKAPPQISPRHKKTGSRSASASVSRSKKKSHHRKRQRAERSISSMSVPSQYNAKSSPATFFYPPADEDERPPQPIQDGSPPPAISIPIFNDEYEEEEEDFGGPFLPSPLQFSNDAASRPDPQSDGLELEFSKLQTDYEEDMKDIESVMSRLDRLNHARNQHHHALQEARRLMKSLETDLATAKTSCDAYAVENTALKNQLRSLKDPSGPINGLNSSPDPEVLRLRALNVDLERQLAEEKNKGTEALGKLNLLKSMLTSASDLNS